MIQELDRTASATASAMGSATFTFDLVPVSQTWLGTVNIPLAPDTAVSFIQDPSTQKGSMIGSNSWGPTRLAAGEQLAVITTGLVPGSVYECNLIGTCYTEQEAPDTWPAAYADAVTTSTENIFLTGPITIPGTGAGVQLTIPTNPRWRSLWVTFGESSIFDPSFTIQCLGLNSFMAYQPFTPPYWQTYTNGGQTYRFIILPGIDSQVRITMSSHNGGVAWIGADLSPVDIAVYPDGSTGFPVTSFFTAGSIVNNPPPAGLEFPTDVLPVGGQQSVSNAALPAGITPLLPPLNSGGQLSLYRIHSVYKRTTYGAGNGLLFGQGVLDGTYSAGTVTSVAGLTGVITACVPWYYSFAGQGSSFYEWQVSAGFQQPLMAMANASGVVFVNMETGARTTVTITGASALTKMVYDGQRYLYVLCTISAAVTLVKIDCATLTVGATTFTTAGIKDFCLNAFYGYNFNNFNQLVPYTQYIFIATTTSNQIIQLNTNMVTTNTLTGGSAGTGYNHIAADVSRVYALGTGSTWSVDVWHAPSQGNSTWTFVSNVTGAATAGAGGVGIFVTGSNQGWVVPYQAVTTSFINLAYSTGTAAITATQLAASAVVPASVAFNTGPVNGTNVNGVNPVIAYVTTTSTGTLYILNLSTFAVTTATLAGTPGTSLVQVNGYVAVGVAGPDVSIVNTSTAAVTNLSIATAYVGLAFDSVTHTFVGVTATPSFQLLPPTTITGEFESLIDTGATATPSIVTSKQLNGRLVSSLYVNNTSGAAGVVEIGYDIVDQTVIA